MPVMSPVEPWYQRRENWHGSFVEVAIDLGPRNDERLLNAFRAAWASSLLDGPLPSPAGDPEAVLDSSFLEQETPDPTYGTVELPQGDGRLGCEVIAIRDDDSDWLDVAVPTGMLELAYPVEYPLLIETNPWIADVEACLVSIADGIYRAVPYDLATIGEEVSGLFYARSADPKRAVTAAAVDRGGGFLISPGLWERLRPMAAAETLESGLRWVRPTGRSYWEGSTIHLH